MSSGIAEIRTINEEMSLSRHVFLPHFWFIIASTYTFIVDSSIHLLGRDTQLVQGVNIIVPPRPMVSFYH
jgi:hypothetical protein